MMVTGRVRRLPTGSTQVTLMWPLCTTLVQRLSPTMICAFEPPKLEPKSVKITPPRRGQFSSTLTREVDWQPVELSEVMTGRAYET